MPDCPHNPTDLKHFPASGNIQCQNCGEVFIPRRRVGQEFAGLVRSINGALAGNGVNLLLEASKSQNRDKNRDSLDISPNV